MSRLRRERNELLRQVPDGREAARRSLAVAIAESRLAADTGGDGGRPRPRKKQTRLWTKLKSRSFNRRGAVRFQRAVRTHVELCQISRQVFGLRNLSSKSQLRIHVGALSENVETAAHQPARNETFRY